VVISVVAIIAVLYLARAVLIPLALAVLLSFVLSPLVRRQVKLGLGRTFSVLSATTLSLLVVAGLGWVMANQTLELAENLPQYRDNIRQKLNSAQSQMHGTLGRAFDSLQQIGSEMSQAGSRPLGAPDLAGQPGDQAQATPPSAALGAKPVRVEIVEKSTGVLESIPGSFVPLLSPLATAGIVIVFVILILLYREDLRDRLIYLIGTGRLTATTQAMDEGASRVSRYLMMLLIVNSSYGLGVGVGLYMIGVPNAVLFGVLAGLVRFVPYVGPWVGAALPIAMSLAVFDSWNRPLITIGLFVVLELVSNNIIEPWLYGSRTGISAVAVMVAAVFWGWLWGPVGLIMSTPLTVCLVVMGRYVPRLEFLNVLLGDEPSLPPEARVYQRLLAADYDDVFQFTQEYLKDKPLIDLYQHVLMPALAMAEHDRQAGRLEEGQDQFIYRSLRDLIEELGDRHRSAVKAEAKADRDAKVKAEAKAAADAEAGESAFAASLPAEQLPASGLVLCISARDEADEISALILAQLLEFEGRTARAVTSTTLAGEMLDEMESLTTKSVCVCAMPPAATSHARYVCKRILARFPDMKVVVGIWNASDLDRARERVRTAGTDRVVATFSHAIESLRS
jgi:predicted PurR-regulated permease PerM